LNQKKSTESREEERAWTETAANKCDERRGEKKCSRPLVGSKKMLWW
jgi:hypothetical protein